MLPDSSLCASAVLTAIVATSCALTPRSLPAQRPPAWVPAPLTQASPVSVEHRGKLCWCVEGGFLRAFSSSTRQWASHPVSPQASIRHTNDWILVEDGSQRTALSAVRGRFESIQVSAQAYTVNPSAGRNDGLLLIADGATLWSFSGLHGSWKQRSLGSAARITVQRNTAVVIEGNQLQGLSAIHDEWIAQATVTPAITCGALDSVGWASDGTLVYGFSAVHNSWSLTPLPHGAALDPEGRHDVAVWASGTELLGFSGVSGSFGLEVTGEPMNLQTADHIGYAGSNDGLRHRVFAASSGSWTALHTATPATPFVDAALTLLTEPGAVHACSALRDGVSTLPRTAASVMTSATLAATLSSGGSLTMFSALTGQWHPAPIDAAATLPLLARQSALVGHRLVDAPAWAFSARSGSFVPHRSTAHATQHADPSSAILAIEDDLGLAVFDPRRERWVETAVQASERPLRLSLWRTTMLATTASEAIGFGALDGNIERRALPGRVVDQRASSEVGVVVTSAGLLGFAALAKLRSDVQFPEFRRMTARGARIALHLSCRPGSFLRATLSRPASQGLRLPGLGEYALEPSLSLPIDPGPLDATGRAQVFINLPRLAALSGLELAFQGLCLPANGSPYLTGMGSFRVD